MVTFSLVATVDISEILVLVEDGLDGDALTRGVRADDRADLILRAQTLGDVDRLLRVALGVVADTARPACRAVRRWR